MGVSENQGFPGRLDGKNLLAVQETQVLFLGQEDPMEKGMATHSREFLGQGILVGSWWAIVHGVAKNLTQLSN